MNYPVLYKSTETDFENNGLGVLSDCTSCKVVEEANGMFEATIEYPTDGIHFADIGDRSIVKIKIDKYRDPQLFRVYSISKTIKNIAEINAKHISYDLSGIPTVPFSAVGATRAIAAIKDNTVVECPFYFGTDVISMSYFETTVPSSVRYLLGNGSDSILGFFGGELEFDNFNVFLHEPSTVDRGFSIRYGKNMTDLKYESNSDSIFTGIMPYWAGEVDGVLRVITLEENVLSPAELYDFTNILVVDLTEKFDGEEYEQYPTQEQLRSKARSYMQNNKIGVPLVSITASFAQLERAAEYQDAHLPDRISLFDTVKVELSDWGLFVSAKVVKLEHNILEERIESVEIGSYVQNVADSIAAQKQELKSISAKISRYRK